MLNALKSFADKHLLFYSKNKIILAVSGGLDSMVLLHLMSQLDVEIVVAHCNFNLRATESDGDEAFVKKVVADLNTEKVKIETISFDTTKYAEENRISIQEAARDLRYAWFETIRKKHEAHWIATAHHLNDNTETLLYNLSKGTGIKGLRGMLPKNGKIIRPMLEISRNEIAEFAEKNKISYREDSSNSSLKYKRNFIRNKIVPEFEQVNPNFEKTQRSHFQRFLDVELFYNEIIEKYKKDLFEKRNDDYFLSILKLQKVKGHQTLLFEMLNTYGFNFDQVTDILACLEVNETKVFKAGNFRLLKTRKHLVLSDLSIEKQNYFELTEKTTKLELPNKELLQIHIKPIDKLTKMSTKAHYAYLDMDLLQFPLVLRRWSDGDYFYPYGMYGQNGKAKKKKLKRFFADAKFSLLDKENTWLLTSGQKIVWIVNQRIDDRFKVNENTKNVYQVKFVECKN